MGNRNIGESVVRRIMNVIAINGTNHHSAELSTRENILWAEILIIVACDKAKNFKSFNSLIVLMALRNILKIYSKSRSYHGKGHYNSHKHRNKLILHFNSPFSIKITYCFYLHIYYTIIYYNFQVKSSKKRKL